MRIWPPFSRDNPTFLVTVLVCGFFLLYSSVGRIIDYFPSLEQSRILTYPLLATGVATFTLRPTNRFAQIGMGVAAILSLETVYTLIYYSDLLPGFLSGFDRFVFAGSFCVVKILCPLIRGFGLSDYLAEPVAYCLLNGLVSCVCAKSFIETTWSNLAMTFGASLVVAFLMACGLEVATDLGLVGIWFMLIHSAFFWHFSIWRWKSDSAATRMDVAASN
jgi:hypothetical protein